MFHPLQFFTFSVVVHYIIKIRQWERTDCIFYILMMAVFIGSSRDRLILNSGEVREPKNNTIRSV